MMANRRALTFLAIAFAFSWSVVSVAWLNGARTIGDAPGANQAFTFGPPVAALICAFVFDKGHRIAALGLWSRPNRWWLVAAILPFALSAYSFAIGELIPVIGHDKFVDMRVTLATLTRKPLGEITSSPALLGMIFAGFALLFTLMFTLTEEMGWRGYFYRQWRGLGFWRFSLVQGVIWGVWHWPLVLLFGMVFAQDRALGLLFYPLALVTASPVMTLLRDRGGSIWAPGIMHGTNNAIGIIVFGALTQETEPNFWALLVSGSVLIVVELFRRRWPDPA